MKGGAGSDEANNPPLHIFAHPATLRQIGSFRLARFLQAFHDDLTAANALLPTPDSENGDYFDSLAAILAAPEHLPNRLRAALFTLEAAATPENHDRLQAAIQRRIPRVELSEDCALDRALELWFHAPDELTQFAPQNTGDEVSRNTEHEIRNTQIASSTIPHPESSIENPPVSLQNPESSIQQPTNPPIHQSTIPASSIEPPVSLIQQSTNPTIHSSHAPNPQLSTLNSQLAAPTSGLLHFPTVDPWPSPVAGHILLNALVQILRRFVVLPKCAAETLALWILHTFAFYLRDVTTYIGIESPEKRCGKTTLLGLLNELANRAVASSNISPPAFFRVIEDLSPTLLIDEVDTFLAGNDQLKGILNAGYNRRTAFVLRAAPTPASNGETDAETSAAPGAVKRYSCWCPKVLAKIGRFPDTLADRCIVIRMQRKTSEEQCDRSRELDPTPLKQQCLRFVSDHAAEIASARPQIPPALNDRAADIWEPLLALRLSESTQTAAR